MAFSWHIARRFLYVVAVVCGSIVAMSQERAAFAEPREVRVESREELDRALSQAKPGTTILLEPGTYRGGIVREGLRGTEQEPIVLASADPQEPATIEGGPSGLHLKASEYVTLRDLIFANQAANGLNIDDGGSADHPARSVALVNVRIQGAAPEGNRDGIKLSGLVDFRIDGCTVERWGKSGSAIDMVGCSRGVVENSRFSNPGALQANGVQTKGGSRDIAIRRCTFLRAGGRAINVGGSTNLAYFRPEPQGFEAKDITVEDCTFAGSLAPIAFVGVDGAVVRHCTIYDPERWVVRILQENQNDDFVPSRNGRFEKNVVAFRSNVATVNVGGKTAPETFVFAGNVWLCIDRADRTAGLVQLPTKEAGGRYDVRLEFEETVAEGVRLRNGDDLDAGVRAKDSSPDESE